MLKRWNFLKTGFYEGIKVIQARDRETLHQFIAEVTADETEAYFTDEWAPYQGIADGNTRHETVNHSLEEWARGEVSTNSVEGVWSLLKQIYHRFLSQSLC